MYFHSIDFAFFLPLVFGVYWLLNDRTKWQNVWIVVASLVFYGWWDWRFLSLLLLSTIVDYLAASKIASASQKSHRKNWLWLSILVNLGLLGFFKYQQFFVQNFVDAFHLFGMTLDIRPLKYVLPVGISFYTFQTLSYTIDVYREKLHPARSFVTFLAYVSFFPQLVAGPIERATHLLPQFYKQRQFSYDLATDGCRQILWGFIKKMVIADRCAAIADPIFSHYAELPGSTLLIGVVCFAFQIYCDFSGYSDIAIGTARLFGFDLMQNFAFPYFSRDVGEFWRRWHISLSSWFKDYVYIPLGGSKVGPLKVLRNVLIVFLISGFWHGAHWKYIAWGAWHALLFLPLLWMKKNRNHIQTVAEGRTLPSLVEFTQMITTFLLVCVGWVFFRADSIRDALHYFQGMLNISIIQRPVLEQEALTFTLGCLLSLFLVTEWLGRHNPYAIQSIGILKKRGVRWTVYGLLMSVLFLFMKTEEVPFLYFQF